MTSTEPGLYYDGIINNMIIYLDMDDVVADWMGTARAIVNRTWNYGEIIPEEDWNKVKAKKRMYRDLPLRAGAVELVEYCRKAVHTGKAEALFFLTALPHADDMQWAAYDKVQWAEKYFPGIPVFFGPYSFDKYKHCSFGDILIDDRTSNCEEWANAGGHAYIYKNWEDCRVWLDRILK
jgi:5'(3')-deoxyribonucleotidase